MDYSKQTLDQLKKVLKERGVTTYGGSMLLEEDGKKKSKAAGGESQDNVTEASGSFPKTSGASSRDYSKQTVDQINKSLKERGIRHIEVFPLKDKKANLVTLLVEEDVKKNQNAPALGIEANITKSSESLHKASEVSSKEEGWIIETQFRSSRCPNEPDINIVGIFTSKEEAIKNAKIAFANMENFKDADGCDNKQLKDYSEKIDTKFDKGCKGGVLFEMDITEEGDTIIVSIYKCFIDKPIRPVMDS